MTNLRRLREERGLSRSQLAEASGVSVRMIEQYELGIRSINGSAALTVYKLAQALGCTVEDLLEE